VKKREEKTILDSFERGEWKSSKPTKKIVNQYRSIARATMAKNMRVNIRLSARDLEGMQARAIEEGIPYQTLMSSVLHKYVSGKLVERA
jgi:predicted DNA binding CopG/RHH family protein